MAIKAALKFGNRFYPQFNQRHSIAVNIVNSSLGQLRPVIRRSEVSANKTMIFCVGYFTHETELLSLARFLLGCDFLGLARRMFGPVMAVDRDSELRSLCKRELPQL